MTHVTTRPANLADLDTLLAFEQGIISAEREYDSDLGDDPISYYDLEALILSSTAEVIVAELGNEIIGSGYADIRTTKPHFKHEQYAYLGFMYVVPSHRGKGVNKLILNALAAWSKTRSISHLYLDVYADNQNALQAYKKAGFESSLLEMRLKID